MHAPAPAPFPSPACSPPQTRSPSPELSFDGASEDTHYVLTPGSTSHPSPHAAAHARGVPVRKSSASSFASLTRGGGHAGASAGIGSIWQLDGEESLSYSSSTRTSPTSAYAQAAAGLGSGPGSPSSPSAADGYVDDYVDDSGTTPKGPGGFWKAAPFAT